MAKPESGIHLKVSELCTGCGRLLYTGLIISRELIDESKWDRSDFFIVWPLPAFMLVTKRIVDFVQEHHLSGAKMTPVSEMEPNDGYTPGRLSRRMPDRRAREFGELLGIY
jgi:hypothetical protein